MITLSLLQDTNYAQLPPHLLMHMKEALLPTIFFPPNISYSPIQISNVLKNVYQYTTGPLFDSNFRCFLSKYKILYHLIISLKIFSRKVLDEVKISMGLRTTSPIYCFGERLYNTFKWHCLLIMCFVQWFAKQDVIDKIHLI